jgi:hypothetical protein
VHIGVARVPRNEVNLVFVPTGVPNLCRVLQIIIMTSREINFRDWNLGAPALAASHWWGVSGNLVSVSLCEAILILAVG